MSYKNLNASTQSLYVGTLHVEHYGLFANSRFPRDDFWVILEIPRNSKLMGGNTNHDIQENIFPNSGRPR